MPADLTTAEVTVLNDWYKEGSNGKRYRCFEVVMVLSTHGDLTTNQKIPASAFKLTTIEGCSVCRKSDNTIILVAVPDYTKANLLLKAAGTNAPAATSGTFKAIVWGT